MALRRKEQQLSLEEIKEKLLQNTKEFWSHGEPLCGYTSAIDKGKLIALHPRAENTILAIFLLDAADYATDRALERLATWLENYRKLPWLPILVFRSNYLFLKNPRFFDRFKNMPSFVAQALYLDEKNEWFDFFKVNGSSLVFSKAGETLYKTSFQNNFSEQFYETELKFQEILRANNPGLPLFAVETKPLTLPTDRESKSYSDFMLEGYWTRAGDAITTEDANAKISFPFQGTYLRLIAITHPKAREGAKAQIFLNDTPLAQKLYGTHVHPGDRGQSILEVNKHTGVYEIIRSDEMIQGTISIKFLNTLENPVVVYGLRLV